MDKKEKQFNVINPSAMCGDGSCGCGCGVPMKIKQDFHQKEGQEAPPSLKDGSTDMSATSKEKPVKE